MQAPSRRTGRPDWHYLIIVLSVMCLLELVNILSGRWLNQYSVIPRQITTLPFIVTAPWLHASLLHFTSNILTLAVLSLVLLEFGLKRYISVSVFVMLMGGILVWIFAREARHLGASGIIYGYFGYIVLAGLLSRRVWLVAISLGVVLFYGGMFWGIFPNQPYVSWESHLFGLISGLVLAWYSRNWQ